MNMRHAAQCIYEAADILGGDNDAQRQDIEHLEQEAIEALNSIAAAGLTEEANILASACGLLSRWKKPARNVSHIEFP